MREPIVFLANILRGLNATLGPQSSIDNYASEMGEELFYEPSVFSYFSPQYRVGAALAGPEFQIYSTQTAADRADVVNSALYGALDKSTKIDLTSFVQNATDTDSLIDYISYVFLHHSMSSDLQQAAASAADAANSAQAKAQAALYVVLTSGEYQIIR